MLFLKIILLLVLVAIINFINYLSKCCNTFICGHWLLKWKHSYLKLMLFLLCWNCNQLDAWIIWKFVAAIIAADHQMSLVGPVFDSWNFHIFYLYNEKEVTEASQGFVGLSLICGRKWMGYSICKLCALATFILLIHSDWEEECLKVKICNPASDLTHKHPQLSCFYVTLT